MSSYHHFSLFSMAISLLLVIVAFLILPLDAQKDFHVKLRHVDSGANLTKSELSLRALKRDEKRLQTLHPMTLADSSHQSINLLYPIHTGGNSEFLINLYIGTPPKPYLAMLDTSSDLIWTQCNPCEPCFDQPHPIFEPQNSSSFSNLPCSNNLCVALHKRSSCGCKKTCEYSYPYGNSSSTQGSLATETFRFGNVMIPEIGFGCGFNNTGEEFHLADGVMGFGRGPLSLVSQLNTTMFSYCLPSFASIETGTLSIRTTDDDRGGSIGKNTPLLKNPAYPSYYYLSLEGITVGHIKLPIDKSTFAIKSNGMGGTIMDSGASITYIVGSAFKLVKKELVKQVKLPVAKKSNETELVDLCFKMTPNAQDRIFPNLTFHFKGVDLTLPKENYIGVFSDPSDGVVCLMMGSSKGMSIFGNFQLQNIQVVYDLKGETLTFVPKNCGYF